MTLVLVLLASVCSYGQNGKLLMKSNWTSESGSQDMLIKSSSITDAYGNTTKTGATLNSNGDYDLFVVRSDGDGNIIWTYAVDGSANKNDFGSFLTSDASGNIYVAGGITDNSSDSFDILLQKLDSSGNQLWSYSKSGGSSNIDIGAHIFFDDSSNVFLVGAIQSTSARKQDIFLTKLSSGGLMKWESSFDINNSYDFGLQGSYNVGTGNCHIFGLSKTDTVYNNWDVIDILVSSQIGGYITHSTYNAWPQNSVVSIEDFFIDDNGNYYLTGMSIDSFGNRDAFVNKISNTFTEDWQLVFDLGENWSEVGKKLTVDDSGYVYVGGNQVGGDLVQRMFVSKISSGGELVWANVFSGSGNTYGSIGQVLVDQNSFVHMCGSAYNGSDLDFIDVVYAYGGSFNTVRKFDGGNGDDVLFDAFVKEDEILLFGQTSTGSGYSFITVGLETYFVKEEVSGNWGGHVFLKNQVIIEFDPSALNSNLDYYNSGESYGELSDYLNNSAMVAMKNAITTNDISISTWKAERILPHWTSADTSSISRNGDTLSIPNAFSMLILYIPESYVDSVAADSLNKMTQYVNYASTNDLGKLSGDYFSSYQTYYTASQQYNNIGVPAMWAKYDGNKIDYAAFVGNPNVKVGIFDSGINWGHEDMTRDKNSRLNSALSRIQGGRCYFCSNTPSVFDAAADLNDIVDETHGTYVAGIIGAVRNNDLGVAGIVGGDGATSCTGPNPTAGVKMYDMKIGHTGQNIYGELDQKVVSTSAIIAAYTDGVSQTITGQGYGLHVLNNSWALPKGQSYQAFTAIMRVMQLAFKSQCVILFASGNDGGDCSVETLIPGKLPDGWAILTGGTNGSGQKESYSNYSARLDNAAPATDDLLYNLLRNSAGTGFGDGTKYGALEGTSFAVPQTTGMAAVVYGYTLAKHALTPSIEDVEKVIEMGSEYFATGSGAQTGHETGRGWGSIKALNIVNTIEHTQFELFHINSDASSGVTPTISVPTTATSSGKSIYLVSGWNSGLSGPAVADIYEVTCSLSFSIPDPILGSYTYWPRHSYADGYQNYNSDIDIINTVPDLYYKSETFNSLNSVTLTSSTSGEAVLTSYFYKITSVNGSSVTPFWYPFDPNQTDPKFGFTLLGTSWPTSVQEIDESKVSIYPNPCIDIVNIELSEEFLNNTIDIALYAIDGKLLFTYTFENQTDPTINLTTDKLLPGIYMFEIGSGERRETIKVVKIK